MLTFRDGPGLSHLSFIGDQKTIVGRDLAEMKQFE
jgi:hypothetical protein